MSILQLIPCCAKEAAKIKINHYAFEVLVSSEYLIAMATLPTKVLVLIPRSALLFWVTDHATSSLDSSRSSFGAFASLPLKWFVIFE